MTVSPLLRRFYPFVVCAILAAIAFNSPLFEQLPERASIAGRPKVPYSESRPPNPASEVVHVRNIHLLQRREELPEWAVPYGGEFWRQQNQGGEGVNIQNAIERVSYALRKTERAFEVAGHGYTATWQGDGVRVATGDSGLNFQTRAVRHGDRVIYHAGREHEDWTGLGNTIQARLDSETKLIEHHEARAAGVEVTWLLSEKPTGKGSFEIQADYTGVAYAGDIERGHRFVDDATGASFVIGKVTAVDATGQHWDLGSEVRGSSMHIHVPETLLAAAAYPLAIDPLISPEFGMDNPILSPAPENQSNPGVTDSGAKNGEIAFNGSTFLVVWSDRRIHPTTDDIWGARVSLTGVVLDPYGIPISTEADLQATPTVAAYDDQFFVVWNDERHGTNVSGSIYGARVNGNGEVLDPHGILITSTTLSSRSSTGHAIATTSYGYFVVWGDVRNNATTGQDVYGARITTAGSILDPLGIPISQARSNQWAVDVELSGDNLLVVWNDERNRTSSNLSDIYGAVVTVSGSVLHPNGIPISIAAGSQTGPALAADSAGFLVVWTDFRNGSEDGDIFGTRVSSSGVVQSAAGMPIHRAPETQEGVAVASNGSLYLVLWRDTGTTRDDVVAARVTSSGVVLDPLGLPISRSPNHFESSVAIAAAADRFLVSWTVVGNYPGYQVEAMIVGIDGLATSERALLSTGGHRQDAPAVASNGEDYLVVWSDYREDLTARRQDIYGVRIDRLGTVLDPNGIAICTVTNRQLLPAVASNGRDYLVVWQDERPRVNTIDIFGARVSGGGIVLDSNGIPICRATNSQTAPAVASNGSDYFVAWQDARVANQNRVFGTRVSASGQVTVADGFRLTTVSSEQREPTVASAAGGYMVAWRDGRACSGCQDIYGARLNGAGDLLDPTGIAITAAAGNQFAPSAAGSDSEYLVVWEDYRNNNGFFLITNSDVFGTRITLSGEVLDPPGLPISVTAGNQSAPAVVHYRHGYFVTWADGRFGDRDGGSTDLFGTTVRTDGTVADGLGFPINTNRFYQRAPAIARRIGSECLVVCQTIREGTLRIGGNLLTLNEPPLSISHSVAVDEDTGVAIQLSGSDLDREPLTFLIVEPPVNGALTGTPPNLVYTPNVDYFGPDSFTFVVSDGEAESRPAVVAITVNPVNDPPRFTPGQNVVVLEDAGQIAVAWAHDIAAGPTNEQGQTVHFVLQNNSTALFSAQPVLDPTGRLAFATAPNANGTALVTVVLRDDGDGRNTSAPLSFEIIVQPVNDPPIAQPQVVSVSEDGSISISLTAGDVDGDNLTYSVSPPLQGTLRGTPPQLTYTPAPNYSGADRFAFKVSDGQAESSAAEVTIHVLAVNDAPVPGAEVFPLVTLLPQEPPVVISPNNLDATVIFDGSRSSDPENDPLQYAWYLAPDIPFAAGVRATNVLSIGDHFITLQVSDGLSSAGTTIPVTVISLAEAMDAILFLIEQLDVRSQTKRPLVVLGKAAHDSFNAGRFHAGSTLLQVLEAKLGVTVIREDPAGSQTLAHAIQTLIHAVNDD